MKPGHSVTNSQSTLACGERLMTGRNVVFDVIFPRGLRLPSRGEAPLRIVRSYRPAHNIGYFRYLECAQLGTNNQPEGEISNWDEIRVAFDPALAKRRI